MRIGIVCYPSIGGSGIVATELGKSLCQLGHEIHFISYDIPQRLIDYHTRCKFHPIKVPVYPVFRFPPYTLALATEIARIAVEYDLDVLHVHYAVPHSTSALLAKQMLLQRNNKDLTIITTLHGTDTDLVGKEPQYKDVVEYSIDACDGVTAVSEHLKRSTLEDFNITKEIRVIYNPINTHLFHPLPNRKVEDHECKTICHISNFRAVKRIPDTVHAFDLISRCIPAKLVLVGDGPEMPVVKELVESLGLSSRVEFAGRVLYVERILQKTDLLLSTSLTESFGMSIAEAMSCEVPVVAYSVGGIPEVAVDGETGYLVEMGDVSGAAEAALQILSYPERHRAMGQAGRKRVMENFSDDRIVKQYLDYYNSLTNGVAAAPEGPGCGKKESRP